jgi:hypothetical protein
MRRVWNKAFRDWSIRHSGQKPRVLGFVVGVPYVQVSALWNTFRLEDSNAPNQHQPQSKNQKGSNVQPTFDPFSIP